jgi:hypothetical protein
MSATTVHRIYTEDKNKRGILRLASAQFESFTVQPTDGYFRGRREQSIVLEIVGARPRQIEQLARQIRRMNGRLNCYCASAAPLRSSSAGSPPTAAASARRTMRTCGI